MKMGGLFQNIMNFLRMQIEELLLWQKGRHPKQIKDPERTKCCPYYWQWTDNPPDKEYYLEEFKSKPTCFQIYETVSEGTPVSPVFETEKEMKKYLIDIMGHSEKAADNFIKSQWVPSGIFTIKTGYLSGIDSAELLK